jgi:hypothetical protein
MSRGERKGRRVYITQSMARLPPTHARAKQSEAKPRGIPAKQQRGAIPQNGRCCIAFFLSLGQHPPCPSQKKNTHHADEFFFPVPHQPKDSQGWAESTPSQCHISSPLKMKPIGPGSGVRGPSGSISSLFFATGQQEIDQATNPQHQPSILTEFNPRMEIALRRRRPTPQPQSKLHRPLLVPFDSNPT